MATPTPPNLKNIQGNIFGGFNKDYQSMLFLHFSDAAKGRAWLGHIAREIATSAEVTAFNDLFKALNQRREAELGILKATWTNLAFTASGLKALGVVQGEIGGFSDAFQQGMAARASNIGDVGPSAPKNWIGHLGSTDVHAVLIVASDAQADLHQQTARYIQNLGFNGTIKLLFTQEGAVRQDQPGHEHFGFKDGVSQPGIKGVTTPDNPVGNPGQGHPGQDLLWPGEFVLGYPKQFPNDKPGVDGPNPDPNTVPLAGPAWAADGSYLVFRRLRQDVGGFHDFVQSQADAQGLKWDVMGGKLVGRYPSGCPMERTKDQPPAMNPTAEDASDTDPTMLTEAKINNFEYGHDVDGSMVPRAAHIRKAYPRDEPTPGGGESDTQTHRLLRRGIPFGTSFRPSLGATSHGGSNVVFPDDRGLLFLAYQTSIEDQFEFVQTNWINNADFPAPITSGLTGGPDGEDPIMAQSLQGSFALPGGSPAQMSIKHFVTTTGGDYFFQPSISALYHIAGTVEPPMP